MAVFYVKALWDEDARVFYSETDIPGLTVEARTLAEFEDLAFQLAPEMLADNLGLRGAVHIDLVTGRDIVIPAA